MTRSWPKRANNVKQVDIFFFVQPLSAPDKITVSQDDPADDNKNVGHRQFQEDGVAGDDVHNGSNDHHDPQHCAVHVEEVPAERMRIQLGDAVGRDHACQIDEHRDGGQAGHQGKDGQVKGTHGHGCEGVDPQGHIRDAVAVPLVEAAGENALLRGHCVDVRAGQQHGIQSSQAGKHSAADNKEAAAKSTHENLGRLCQRGQLLIGIVAQRHDGYHNADDKHDGSGDHIGQRDIAAGIFDFIGEVHQDLTALHAAAHDAGSCNQPHQRGVRPDYLLKGQILRAHGGQSHDHIDNQRTHQNDYQQVLGPAGGTGTEGGDDAKNQDGQHGVVLGGEPRSYGRKIDRKHSGQ